jgi:GH25 family lysozyme M1 (1,4-beta-N-acetylmuramidase)
MIAGIDVSSVQGTIDWPTVAASGMRFAYIKCGNGNDEVDGKASDPSFARNVAGARAAGLVVGAYHFLYPLPDGPGLPSGRSPEDQAQLHYAASGGLGGDAGDLPVMMDAEWPDPTEWKRWGCSAAQISDWLTRYAAKYEALGGRSVGLYSDRYFWTMILGANLTAFAGRPFWPAQPVGLEPIDGSAPFVWPPWKTWGVWQWNQGMRVPGVGDNVDCDVIESDATLAALLVRP